MSLNPYSSSFPEFIPQSYQQPLYAQEHEQQQEAYEDEQYADDGSAADASYDAGVGGVWSECGYSNVSVTSPGSVGISAVAFDVCKELLWAGSYDGRLISLHNGVLDRRTACQAHSDSIISLHSTASGVFSLGRAHAKYHTRGGVMRKIFKTGQLNNFTASLMSDPSEPFVLLSSSGSGGVAADGPRFGCDATRPAIGSLDIYSDVVRREVNIDSPYSCLARSRYAIGGRWDGFIDLRDPRSLRLEQSLTAHQGACSQIITKGDLIISCGFSSQPSSHHPHPRIDPFIKIFDLRTMKSMAPIVFSAGGGPSFIKNHPLMPSLIMVASNSGLFQLMDIDSGVLDDNIYQISQPIEAIHNGAADQLVTAMDFSSSGECLALVDNYGFVHEWTNIAPSDNGALEPLVNGYSIPLDDVEPPQPPALDDGIVEPWPSCIGGDYVRVSLALPPEADWTGPLASFTDPAGLILSPDIIQPPIDVGLIKDLQWDDYVGYVTFGKKKQKRDRPRGPDHEIDGLASESDDEEEEKFIPNCLATLKQFAGQGRNTEKIFKRRNFVRSLADLLHSPARQDLLISQEYARVNIKIPRFGLYAFDFSQFNHTKFTGLDNLLPNSYVNSCLHILYFIIHLRQYFLSHICERDHCLTCELGFLFHMLAQSAGATAEPRNFLRALRSIPEAGGLNLLDESAVGGAAGGGQRMALGLRIQDFLRFLLEQLNKEEWQDKKKQNEATEALIKQQRIFFDLEKQKSHRALNYQLSQLQASLQTVNASLHQLQAHVQSASFQRANPHNQHVAAIQMNFQQLAAQQRALLGQIQANQAEAQQLLAAQYQPSDELAHGAGRTMAERVFGFKTLQIVNCSAGHQSLKEIHSLSMKLTYNANMHRGTTFVELLRQSLTDTLSRRLWCDLCSQYQNIDTVKCPLSFPYLFNIAANVQTDAELEIWRFQRKKKFRAGRGLKQNLMDQFDETLHIHDQQNNQHKQKYSSHAHSNAPSHAHAHGSRASGPHDEAPGDDDEDDEYDEDTDYNWLPQYLRIDVDANTGRTLVKRLTQSQARDQAAALVRAAAAQSPVHVRSAVYELIGVVSHISDPPEKDSPLNVTNGEHLVSHIKVSREDLASAEQQEKGKHEDNEKDGDKAKAKEADRWFVFNDFVIRKSSAVEATRFSYQWKQPSILFFSCLGPVKAPPSVSVPHPLASAPIIYHQSLSLRGPRDDAGRTFTALQSSENLHAGSLVAIDCEFVSVQEELTEFDQETGENVVVRPARLTLARVSVVRGEGPLVGVPLIDDYIATSEPVVDYLTPFSGLVAGDLDRSISVHHLVTLKQAYIRLRTLVDRGVVFIGHGLKKDFQMINIVVPANQIKDTVEIYWLPKQRKLGLRFLARYVLNLNIQEDSHDSIEDSRTALALWKKHESILAQPNGASLFQQLLGQLYQQGHKTGFKV